MGFGERLRSLREEKKITQKELAKLFKIAESTVSMYERGEREPNFEIVNKIANFFNVSTDYLLGRTDDPTPPRKSKDPFSDLPKDAQIFFKDFDKLSDEDKKKVAEHIKFLLHLAEKENKKE